MKHFIGDQNIAHSKIISAMTMAFLAGRFFLK